MASCTENEYSYPDSEQGNGIFTRALCDALLEFPPGFIYPESLKIRVVEKVTRRTGQLGCRQTPVMNASIRGNVSIASRRIPPLTPYSGIPSVSELTSRVAALRIFPRLGGPEHKTRLHSYINTLCDYLESKKNSFSLGFSPEVSKPQSVNNAPAEFSQRIVLEVASMGSPNHEITQESVEIMEHRTAIEEIISPGRGKGTGKYRTVYRVRQLSDWPESWCTIKLLGDGYIPSFLAGFYLIPFQFKALLVCIVASKGASRSSDSSWSVEAVTKDVITLEQEATPALAEGLVRTGLSAFEDVVMKLTHQRLSNLEQELMPKKS